MGTYSLLIGHSQPLLELEEKKQLELEEEQLEIEEEEHLELVKEQLKLEEKKQLEKEDTKNANIPIVETITGTVTIRIVDGDIKKEKETDEDTLNKMKEKDEWNEEKKERNEGKNGEDMDKELVCAPPEACGRIRRNESAGESEPEMEAEGGKSEGKPDYHAGDKVAAEKRRLLVSSVTELGSNVKSTTLEDERTLETGWKEEPGQPTTLRQVSEKKNSYLFSYTCIIQTPTL